MLARVRSTARHSSSECSALQAKEHVAEYTTMICKHLLLMISRAVNTELTGSHVQRSDQTALFQLAVLL
jgi:hypothetical protein